MTVISARFRGMTTNQFLSAYHVLAFAYNDGKNRHAVAAAAERQMAGFAKVRYKDLPYSFLPREFSSGMESAAQAGMIKARVEALKPQYRWAIESKFETDMVQAVDGRPRMIDGQIVYLLSPVRKSALTGMALFARKSNSLVHELPLELLSILTQRHYGASVQFNPLVERFEIAERSLARRWSEIHRYLAVNDQLAINAAEVVLEGRGYIPQMAA